jgi:molybdopterin-guanine dinucleotide biosynthesis protein A
MMFVTCAGVLLTGGRSRRMGRDKATLRGSAQPLGPTLAERTADLLNTVCQIAVEVGPGCSALPAVAEAVPGQGPLVAVAAAWIELGIRGWSGPVLVVATDLPRLNLGLLRWLADHPGSHSVVPVAARRVQPLCARYRPEDLDLAARLVGDGERSMTALIDAVDADLVDEQDWLPAAGDASVLLDVDTPADLKRSGW